MSRHPLHSLLFALALLGGSAAQAVIVIVEFTWTGKGGSSQVTNANNWGNNEAPTFVGGAEKLIFADQRPDFVWFNTSGDVYGLDVQGHYHFTGSETTLHLYEGGLTFSSSFPTHLVFENYIAVDVAAPQIWNIGANTRVEFYNNALITGSGKITKTGAGTLDMQHYNASGWTGGVDFNEGTIVLRPGNLYGETTHSSSLGIGTVTIGPDIAARPHFEVLDWSYNTNGPVSLTNNLVLNGIFASRNETELQLLGDITLNADTTFRTKGDITVVEGAIGESGGARKLTVDSTSALVLSGASNWTGGTEVTKGALIFAGDTLNLPATGNILVGTDGYAGIGVVNSISSFMGKLNTASTGTIGFDSDPEGSPDLFNPETTIDLSGFSASLRLGSATHAILGSAVTITPFGTNYRFGGGGGWLQVNSALTTGRTVTLDSPSELPLTVRLTNTGNAFTGITVTNSGAVFADNALPGSATLSVNAGAYLGSEDPDVSTNSAAINAYVTRIGAGTSGIIGFDIDQFALSATTRVIDLTGVNGLTGSGYLGTASALFSDGDITGPGVRFTGTIAPNSDNVHRFAAYKGGALEVAGTLTGNAMIVGHPGSLGAFGDRTRDEYSTVLVSGDNGTGLAGGTTLFGGRLMLGHNQALGAGALTIAPVTFTLEEEDGPETPSPLLATYAADLVIGNAIHLNAPELNVGGDNNFTLSGLIDGPGELYVGEESGPGFVLTLSGNNTLFTGGTYITEQARLIAKANNALGQGMVGLGGISPTVDFMTSAPSIGGLYANENGARVQLQDNATLTINQAQSSVYRGSFFSLGDNTDGGTDTDSLGSGRIIKTGSGTLRLEGEAYFSPLDDDLAGPNPAVGFAVSGGTLVAAHTFALGSGNVIVNGGTLALDNFVTVNNTVNVVSGRVAGFGSFNSSMSIGTGAILSPGLAEFGNIGMLTIDHLELNSGGTLEWHIMNPSETGGGRDFVQVGYVPPDATLVINATSASPADKFTLKIISLDLAGVEGGVLSGVDRGHGLYAWTLFNYDTLDTTNPFDPNAFALEVSQFRTGDGTGLGAGTFSVFQSGNQIMLGFTPVPEPSTYALLALGLGFIGLTLWRRRHAS